MYVEGEVPYMTNCNTGYNNGGWGFGNGWEGLIGLVLVAALFGGGWGGFGFGGGRGGSPATQADLSAGFANSEILSDLNDIILGQARMQNFINQGFAGLDSTVTTGFAGVNNAICTLGYQNQAGFNTLGTQLADCCCKIERGIDAVNYNLATNTCAIQTSLANATRDIIDSQRTGTDRILGFLTSEKISALQSENAALKGQISNDRQTKTIVSELRDGCPIPAYLTCNPNAPYGYGYGFPFPYAGYATGCCGASIQ